LEKKKKTCQIDRLDLYVASTKDHFTETCVSLMTQGPDPKAANELISIDGVLNAIIRNLEKAYVTIWTFFIL
jgi:hypothetical protein